jgi:RimJ/RimL family protein N-acetyltransferase
MNKTRSSFSFISNLEISLPVRFASCWEEAASIPIPKVGIECPLMHNNNGIPLIVYAPPRIGDWNLLSYLITDNFPNITKDNMSYLIRNGMNKMLVARRKQQLLGFCYFEEFSHNKLHLLWLATDKDYYQRGVASQLLTDLNCYAFDKGYKSIVLTVHVSNLAAKKLYEKLGYVLTENRKSENKESWEKILSSKCSGPVIKYSFWTRNYYLFRVFKKILYRFLVN